MISKISKIYFFVAFLSLFIIWIAYLIVGNPLKISDPNDPNFNPEKFDFCDYENRGQVKAALKSMFPPGTPKEYVDKILIEIGGADYRIQQEIKDGVDLTTSYIGQPNKLCSFYFKLPPSYQFDYYTTDLKLRDIK